LVATIPGDEPSEDGVCPVVCIAEEGSKVALTKGNLIVTVYNINGSNASKSATRDL